ncbi:MAG: excisionase [Thiothrix sp.]|uniref:excisionase n=1 Tax=Thiothrix sp. TaxID=1032 RepID=UPI0026290D64|nr:excisionase [Thiothrix sp.]MDD5393154.1 excisionase [Thiothrix sp.]
MKKLVLLETWAKMRYPDLTPTIRTLRRWVKEGRIQPQPIKHGKYFRVREDAVYFDAYEGIGE